MLKRWTPFDLTFKGSDAFELHVPRSGFRYTQQLEMRLASQWAGYKYWDEFVNLDGDIQSDIVATYRANNQIQGLLAYEMKKRSRPRKSGR